MCTYMHETFAHNTGPMMDKLMNGFADVLKMCITLNFSLMSFLKKGYLRI
jgi:hypothetical protein